MKFTKLHELGSDCILFDARDRQDRDWSAFAKRVCDRRTGVGADCMLLLLPSETADVRMRKFQCDGSEPAQCADGLRAFSRYAFENGVIRGTSFSVETASGVVHPCIVLQNGRVDGVRIDLGEPSIDAASVPVAVEGRAIGALLSAGERAFSVTALRMQETHTVVFVDALREADVLHYGPLIEQNALFPAGTHVDFCEVLDKAHVKLMTHLCGKGAIPACAAGAGAAAVACALMGKTGRCVDVALSGGTLRVEWSEQDNHVYLFGPAAIAFTGIWND